ncbi:MAG: type IV pilus secretin PilQ [bacterium]
MKRSQILITTLGVFLLFLITGCATENASVQTSKPEPSAPVTKVSTIQKITFVEEENYTKIQIEGSEPIASPFYKLLSDPLRIAIDVPDIDLRQIKSPLKIDNGTIGEILTTQYDDKGRIEIGLLQMTNYNISKEEKNLIIDVEKVRKVEQAKEAKEVKKEEEALKETKVEVPVVETKKEEPLPTPPPMKKAKKVVKVAFEEKKDFITFNILADGKIGNFDTFKLGSPPRLVLDVWGVDTRKSSFNVKNPLIKAVRIGHYPDKLRLVFDSRKPQLPPYQVNRIDDKLIVSLGNIPQPSEPQIFVQGKSTKESPAGPPKAQAESPGKPSTLTGMDFKRMDDKSRVVLSLSEENPQFESSTPSKEVIAIEVKNASVPKNLLKGLDASAFKSVVNHVELKNVKVGKTNDILILVKLGEEAPYETTKEGNKIFIDIKERPAKIEAKAEAQPQEAKKEEIKKEEEVSKEVKPAPESKKEEEVKKEEKPILKSKKQETKAEDKPVPQPPETKKSEEVKKVSEAGASQKAYTGTKLSLDFKDADIKNILRLIAEVSNLNIIVADEVTGKITMRLVDVPWDQALDIILQSKNLARRQVGNVVRIAPVEALRKEDQAKLEEQRSKEKLEPLVHELIPVNYATAKEIMPQVKSILSERGDVKVDDRTNTLIIKDISRTLPGVKNLVKALDTRTPMVLIEARIVEANLTFQNELGVQWGFLLGGAKAKAGGGGVTTTTTPSTTGVLGTAVNEVVNLAASPRTGLGAGGAGTAGLLSAVFSRGTIQELDVTLSAHEFKGDVKIISSPKIATLDNKEASIEQGLRFPYLVLTTEGTVSTNFIDADLKLTVTPHVTNDGTIKLIIKVKKDAPSNAVVVQGTPSIDKKEAISEVLIRDGGVAAIAGLYTRDKEVQNEGVPLFNKIPLLGWLFKSQNNQDNKTDLLIFISPKIMKDEV